MKDKDNDNFISLSLSLDYEHSLSTASKESFPIMLSKHCVMTTSTLVSLKKYEDIFLDLCDLLFILLPITTLAVHFLIYQGMSEPVWKPGRSNWLSIICSAALNSFSGNGVPTWHLRFHWIASSAVGGWGFELYFFVSQ